MNQVPAEVLALVLKSLPSVELPNTASVCSEWNSILTTNSSLWRTLSSDFGSDRFKSGRILKLFSDRSNQTLETVILRDYLWAKPLWDSLFVLDLSKASLRSIEIGIQFEGLPQEYRQIFKFFRTFPNLYKLNMSRDNLIEITPDPGESGLLLLAARDLPQYCYSDWTEEETQWCSNIKFLYIDMVEPGEPSCVSEVAKCCTKSLIELRTGREQLHKENFNLPKLKSLVIHPWGLPPSGVGQVDINLEAPDLREVDGEPSTLSLLHGAGFQRLEALKVRIWSQVLEDYTTESEGSELEELAQKQSELEEELVYAIRTQESSVQRIQLLDWYKQVYFSIDLFLRDLGVARGSGISFPKLSELYISQHQKFDMKLLAEMLLLRRLTPAVDSCSNLVLFIPSSEISRFQFVEEKLFSENPDWIDAGKADVRKLEEWKDYWAEEA